MGPDMARVTVVGVLLCACVHERLDIAAAAIGCPSESTVLMSEADARPLPHPREHTAQETAANAGTAALGALANAAIGRTPASATAFYLPANGVMVMSPGWRQYEGCQKAIVCFDGGFCMRSDDEKTADLARRVPALMEKSAAEAAPVAGCQELAVAERRGLLAWSITRCNVLRLCTVEHNGAYACNGEDQPGR
jgi:hypothetical protein